MPIEIERKFLVNGLDFRTQVSGSRRIIQGYFDTEFAVAIRVRVAEERAFLTIKGKSHKISCSEYEYEIPIVDATAMLKAFCADRIVEKVRFEVTIGEHVWEVDEYLGDNFGLITAEIELDTVDESFALPNWVGEEISLDNRYKNAALARHPFAKW